MARIERATSPLPRECSTTEPHGHRHRSGLGQSPDPWRRTLERETGIEPASLAWKAKVLPLTYSRLACCAPASLARSKPEKFSLLVEEAGFEPA